MNQTDRGITIHCENPLPFEFIFKAIRYAFPNIPKYPIRIDVLSKPYFRIFIKKYFPEERYRDTYLQIDKEITGFYTQIQEYGEIKYIHHITMQRGDFFYFTLFHEFQHIVQNEIIGIALDRQLVDMYEGNREINPFELQASYISKICLESLFLKLEANEFAYCPYIKP